MLENQFSEEYRTFFWNNPLPMWVYDIETLKFLAVNEAAIHNYGYTRDEFLSMTIKDIRPFEDVPLLLENLKKIPEKLERSGDWRHKKKDGTIIDVEVTSHETLFEGKKTRLVLAVDITVSKRANKALELAEERFRTLVEQSLTGIYIIQEGQFTYVNPRFAEIFGYKQSEIINSKTVLELVAPYHRKKVSDNIQKRLSGEIQSIRYSFKGLKKDGVIIDLQVHGAISELNSKPAIIGTLVDITARRKIERDLKHRLELEKIIAQISNNFVNLDHDEVESSINDSLRLIGEFLRVDIGYVLLYNSNQKVFRNKYMWPPHANTPDTAKFDSITAELFPWGVEKIINFENVCIPRLSDLPIEAELEKILLSSLGVKSLIAVPLVYKNNLEGFFGFDSKKLEINWADEDIWLIKIVGEIFINAIMRGITEERLITLSSAIEQAAGGVIITDKNGVIEYVNPSFEKLYGYAAEEIVGKNPNILKSGKDRNDFYTRLWTTLSQGDVYAGEFINKNKNGKLYYWEGSITPIKNKRGTITHYVSVGCDVTKKREAEEALKQSEKKYRMLHDSMTDAFVRVDMSGKLTEFNIAYKNMLGYSEEELHKLTYVDLTPEKWHSFEAKIVKEQIMKRGYSDVYEKEYVKKDGEIFPVDLRTFLISDEDGQPSAMWAIVRDITERKQTEDALRESEEKYRNLVERANDGILIIQDGLIKYANPYIAKLWVGDIQGLPETSFLNYVHPDYLVKVADIYKRRMAGESVATKYEIAIKNKSGEKREVELNAGLINYKGKPADLVIIRDITERKAIEEERVVSNIILQSQVTELQNSKKAISILLEEVTSKRDENTRLLDIVSKRQQQLEVLSRELIFIEERERKKFSQDLHDSLGQILTTLKINVELAVGKADSGNSELQNYLNECATLSEEAMNEARQLSYALRPSVLDDFGLNAALRMLVTQTQKRINISIELSLDVDDSRYDPIIETVIYRIVQEGMTNIAKHSKASKAWVQLMRRNSVLALSIIDNGIGFTHEKTTETQELHFGLRNIRERVEFLGGKLYIESGIGKGTEIAVEIDIKG
jgi:PAS domain S-box-containing protein